MKNTLKTKWIAGMIAAATMLTLTTAGYAQKDGGTKPYDAKICIVSGNELGSMGKVITKKHEAQEVKFCCKPCVKKFDKNPDRYLKDLRK